MKTDSLYLSNIFNDVLAYFAASHKKFESSSIVSSTRSLFQIACEYVKEDWKGVKQKYMLTCDLREIPDCRVLFLLTNDKDAPQHCKAIRILPDDKEKDIVGDIINFCELNEIKFK